MPFRKEPDCTSRGAVNKQLGMAIRHHRLERERQAASLAAEIGVPPSRLAAIEDGLVRPSARELYDIAKALGTTISDLFRDVQVQAKPRPCGGVQ